MKSSTQSVTKVANARSYIEQLYIKFRTHIEEYQTTIEKYKAANSKVKKVQTDIVSSFSNHIKDINSDMQQTIEGMVWDNLVIAFFGETNAGKSTTIETLRILFDKKKDRKKDGAIVGDGRQDFTKTYAEYQLNIYGQPFTLIDVPGIEGKEEDFKDDIKRALQQAHLVFYVQGHNQKPDAATAAKIKRYLNDWVNVYSIYNVRSAIGEYRDEADRKTLLSENVNYASMQIEDTLKGILGNVYKGNIPLQSLLALCSEADFSHTREDLAKTQKKAANLWGNLEKVYQFSNFEKIVNLIQNKTEHFDEELIAANTRKINSLCRSTYAKIDDLGKIEEAEIKKLNHKLREFQREIRICVLETESHIRENVWAKSNAMFAELQKDICNTIDNSDFSNDEREQQIQNIVDDFVPLYCDSITDIVETGINHFNEKMEEKQKGYVDCFSFISGIHISGTVNINIDTEEIVKELRYTFSKFAEDLASVLLGLLGGWIGIIFAVLGWGVDRFTSKAPQAKAKSRVANAINEAKSKTHSMLSNSLRDVDNQIVKQANGIAERISNDLRHIQTIQYTIEDCKEYITYFAQNINQQ